MPSEPALSLVVRPSGRAPYVITLERLTALIRAARVLRMGRLADTLKKAADARTGLETAIEADVTKYVDRVREVHKRRESVFMAKHSDLDLAVTDLAEFEKDLDDFGKNDHSGDGGSAYAGTTATTSK
jgi:hypothetical protein